jgi:acetyltransferase-like isoleucine patch superfamily enzyme
MKAGRGVTIERPHRITYPEFIRIGDGTCIHQNALIAPIPEYAGVHYTPEIVIGRDVYIGPNLFLACVGRISIGDGSVLSESVFINDSNHGLDPEAGPIMKQTLVQKGEIIIGNCCFLGLRCAILPGVVLGDHCVVGINSVVTTSFPAYSMIGGSPARLIRTYSSELKAWV